MPDPPPRRHSRHGATEPAPPLAERDLHALAWWLIERVLLDDNPGRRERFTLAAALLRVLGALGTHVSATVDASRETELRARVLHGRLPRDDAEWDLARTLFDDDALALLASLAESDEADRGDRRHPLPGGQRRADEIELTGAGEHDE